MRELLGEDRCAAIQERAERFAAQAGERDAGWWRAQRDASPQPFATLDPDAARETLDLERDELATTARYRAAETKWLETQERARHSGPGGRPREITNREAAPRYEMRRAQIAAIGLEQQQNQLRREGRHLDNWMDAHAHEAARWLAAEQALATEPELTAAQAGAQVIELHPPPPAVEPAAAAGFEM